MVGIGKELKYQHYPTLGQGRGHGQKIGIPTSPHKSVAAMPWARIGKPTLGLVAATPWARIEYEYQTYNIPTCQLYPRSRP